MVQSSATSKTKWLLLLFYGCSFVMPLSLGQSIAGVADSCCYSQAVGQLVVQYLNNSCHSVSHVGATEQLVGDIGRIEVRFCIFENIIDSSKLQICNSDNLSRFHGDY